MSFVPLSRTQLEFIAEEFWPGGGENGDGRDLYGVAEHHGVWREETTDADLIAEALHPSDADYYDRHRVDEMNDAEYDAWLAEDDADEEPGDVDPYDDRREAQPHAALDADWFCAELEARDPHDDGPAVAERFLDDGEDEPNTLALTREIVIDPWCWIVPRRWNQDDLDGSGIVADTSAKPSGPGVASALARFARDGVTKVSMRFGGGVDDDRRRRHEHRPNIGRPSIYDIATNAKRSWNGRQRFDSWKRHREAQYRLRHIDRTILDRAERRRTANGSLRYLDPDVLYLRAA